MMLPYERRAAMTKKELLELYVKLGKKLDTLEDAALILADEPFASKEPDNDVFCGALRLRIERFRAVAAAVQKELLSGQKQSRNPAAQE